MSVPSSSSLGSPLLTVVVLTLNEAARIGRCVRSLRGLPPRTRLVILDSFSSDETVSVARQVWSEIGGLEADFCSVLEEWRGFTRARNRSLELCSTPWALWVDADEWLSEGLVEELASLRDWPNEVVVGRMPRLNTFLGREIRHGGWFPDVKSRVGRVGRVEWKGGPRGADVHEDLVAIGDGERRTMRGLLRHEPFRDEAEQRDTNVRYSALLAAGLAEKWRDRGFAPPKFFVWGRVVWKFFENYLWKRGCLDGRPGLRLALGSAWSLKERYRKAFEIRERGA